MNEASAQSQADRDLEATIEDWYELRQLEHPGRHYQAGGNRRFVRVEQDQKRSPEFQANEKPPQEITD